MHSNGFSILLFVIFSLLIGALLKAVMHKSRLPYTVVLLLIGIAAGGLNQIGLFGTETLMSNIFTQVGHIDPHLILFLFLPTLIFESAYSMEPHLFFRIAPQILLLSVVGLIISMVLSALAIHWLLSWGLGAALLFGALISATDPVAVVALLKEKSSRKRLETLIEGESLLNDGTAIVFFSLFYGFALGTTTEVKLLDTFIEFIWVVAAGLLIGAAIGWIILWVIGKLLNQPLIEISLSVVAAYLTFIIAETLHVSGVVALVSLALMFSTIGRTLISPEISHFLHQFWEMMTYMANTLIFLIVGIVIMTLTQFDSPQLWLTLGILYILLILIRSVSVIILMPLLERIGVGINRKKAIVLVWGGLRGAVSLSLALSLAQDMAIPQQLREQILFLTAGIVFLTIVINGSTMEWLLHLLKLDQLPPAKEASIQKARQTLDHKMSTFLKTLSNNYFFNLIKLDSLEHLSREDDKLSSNSTTESINQEDINIAFMRRLLEIERSDYWQQFEDGHIGRQAAFLLSRSIEHALDNEPVISPRTTLEESFKIPNPPKWIQKLPIMGQSMDNWLFTRLSLNYDVARGFVAAQEVLRQHIQSLQPDEITGGKVEAMIDKNCTQVFSFIRHINQVYPQLIEQLQSKSAKRLLLNHERSLIWGMQHDGILETAEAQHLIDNIETKMIKVRKLK
ncbi:MAG: sodium:proton antiporter [Methylococcales bacterium]|jgi:NhaP-type Na+/H+ or K+/H+ antiporter|nr:sodium:proton antiporter [Methylococcales bacterium]MBT7409229.1 sodium:proton antiporter [Methylococcales bacterium]